MKLKGRFKGLCFYFYATSFLLLIGWVATSSIFGSIITVILFLGIPLLIHYLTDDY